MKGRRNPSWIAWGAGALFVMLVVYPLSYGPVVSIYIRFFLDKGGAGSTSWADQMLWAFYFPVDIAFEQASPWIQRPFNAYFEWWTGMPVTWLGDPPP